MKTLEITKEYLINEGKRTLTLYAIAEDCIVLAPTHNEKGELDYVHEKEGTVLSVGWALKDPTDTVSPASLGKTIARGRAVKSPLLYIRLMNDRMTAEFVTETMDSLAKDMDKRFYSYIPLGTNGKNKKNAQKEQGKEVVTISTQESGKTKV